MLHKLLMIFGLMCLLILSSCEEPPRDVSIESIPVLEAKFMPYDGGIPKADGTSGPSFDTYTPRYVVRYSSEGGDGIFVDVEFFDKESTMVDPRRLLGGRLYCVMTHPDGEIVKYVTDIPPGKPRMTLDVRTSKITGWSVVHPNIYNFSFSRDIRGDIDEYETQFGFSRMTPLAPNPDVERPPYKYFRIEGNSMYDRGIFDGNAARLTGRGADKTFSDFKQYGFNLYITDRPLTMEELQVASEMGIMCAWISREPVSLQAEDPMGKAESPEFYQQPSVLGECVLETEALEVMFRKKTWDSDYTIEFTGTNGKSFDSFVIPSCEPGFSEAAAFIMSGETPGPVEGSEHPQLLSMFGIFDEGCIPPGVDLYEFVNLVRRAEYCAGFVIPAEMFEGSGDRSLLTDDFLLLDIGGFPLETPLVVKAGSTIHLPVRLTNFKAKGDEGGAIWWRWDETSHEGRVLYPELPYKGTHELPALKIDTPANPGEYNLRFEVFDPRGIVLAFNSLSVIVE